MVCSLAIRVSEAVYVQNHHIAALRTIVNPLSKSRDFELISIRKHV